MEICAELFQEYKKLPAVFHYISISLYHVMSRWKHIEAHVWISFQNFDNCKRKRLILKSLKSEVCLLEFYWEMQMPLFCCRLLVMAQVQYISTVFYSGIHKILFTSFRSYFVNLSVQFFIFFSCAFYSRTALAMDYSIMLPLEETRYWILVSICLFDVL